MSKDNSDEDWVSHVTSSKSKVEQNKTPSLLSWKRSIKQKKSKRSSEMRGERGRVRTSSGQTGISGMTEER